MIKLVTFNDPHYSRHAPECRADSYPLEVLDKLHACARVAVKIGARGIGCTGDWFHRKGKVTFREANDLLSVLRTWGEKGLDVFGILGNHDIAGHALESLDNRAVGSLVHSRVLNLLDHHPLLFEEDGTAVYVTGTSYFHGCDADDEARVRAYGAERPPEVPEHAVHVHLAHGTLINRGEFFEDFTVAPELVDLLAEHDRLPDAIVCGHLHFSEGVRGYPNPLRGGEVSICRVGSIGRVASDDLEREPVALVIAARGGRVAFKEVPVGKEPKRGAEREGGRDPAEAEVRVKEFVRVLRERADEWELADHSTLIQTLAQEKGHDEATVALALEALEKHQ